MPGAKKTGMVNLCQNGRLWSVPLLSQSIHGLGWNFIRGQTARLTELRRSPHQAMSFRAYGQFPSSSYFCLWIRRRSLPGEKAVYRQHWSIPPTLSWRRYLPIQQSYWAGKMDLIRIHGSEKHQICLVKGTLLDSYNWNPTIGCLSALELYDKVGKLQQADMPKIQCPDYSRRQKLCWLYDCGWDT